MKMAHEPNFEILGTPIGDVILCNKFLAQKRAKAVKLLSQLLGVGSLDPQIALLLLRQCASFCKLVHLARSMPPSLVSEGLALFDEEVRRYFSDCVIIDALDSDWLQVQLSLSRGGLGLCRLALHCSAAYLATIIKAGCADPLDEFTLQAITVYNSLVLLQVQSQSVESLVDSGLSQKNYLPELMTINSTSCASSHLRPTVPRSPSLYGRLNLVLVSVKVEAGNNLTPDHSHTRPADVLVQNWSRGRPAAFDICVTSPLNTLTLSEAGVCAGAAAQAGEVRKHSANDDKCEDLGWFCVPLVTVWSLKHMSRSLCCYGHIK